MKRYLLGADFGTSGVKCCIIDTKEKRRYVGSLFEYPTYHNQPQWSEQNPKEYWGKFCMASREILDISGADPAEIEAIGISSQGHGVIAVDKNGDDLGLNMIWQDARTEEQCRFMQDNFAEDIRKTNGNAIKVLFPVPGILWEKQYAPEKYNSAVKYMGVSPFINFKLTDKYTVNPSEGSLIHCFNIAENKWDEDLAEKLGIPVEKFPEIKHCSEFIGEVTEKAAAETGLCAGTKVIGGGHDTTSAALALGVVSVGQAFYSMGTGSNLGVITAEPKYDASMTVQSYVIPNMWIFDAVMNSTGYSMKWFAQQFGQELKQLNSGSSIGIYDLLGAEAAQSPVGSRGVIYHPYLQGESCPIWDDSARASFVGITGRTTRGDMVRALMEGICYSARHNMEVFESCDSEINELIVCGGPAKSALWMQILSDVLGKVVKVTENEDAAPVGDAMLAGVASGVYASFEEAAEENVHIKTVYYPNPENKKVYDELYEVYVEIYKGLKPQFAKLAKY